MTTAMIVERGRQLKSSENAKAIRTEFGGFALDRSFELLRLSVIARCLFSTHLQISMLLSKIWIVSH